MLHFNSNSVRSIIGVGALCTAFSAQAASITALDFLPTVISGDSGTIAGYSGGGRNLAVRQNDNTQFFEIPNDALQVRPFGISSDGSQLLVDGLINQFLVSNTGVFTEFSTIAGAENFTPTAISGDGNTFAGRNSSNQAAVFNNGEIQVLNSSDESGSAADISADGRTVVGTTGGRTVIWRDGIETSFGLDDPLSGVFSIGSIGKTVSADGSTALGFNFDRGLFVYRNETSTLLQTADGESPTDSSLNYISGDGEIIIAKIAGSFIDQTFDRFFIWELGDDGNYVATELTDRLLQLGLDTSAEGWRNLTPNDISDDGRYIIGRGFQIDNLITTGFLIDLHPVPLPASAWLFASAFIGLVGFKKAKQSTTNKR